MSRDELYHKHYSLSIRLPFDLLQLSDEGIKFDKFIKEQERLFKKILESMKIPAKYLEIKHEMVKR